MEMVVAIGANEIKKKIIVALSQRAAQIAAEQALQTAAVASISWVPIIGQIAVGLKIAGYVLTCVNVLKLIWSLIEYLNKGQTGSLTEEQRRLLAEVEAQVKEDMKKKGTANGNVISAGALLFVIYGHIEHHFNVLKELYLKK